MGSQTIRNKLIDMLTNAIKHKVDNIDDIKQNVNDNDIKQRAVAIEQAVYTQYNNNTDNVYRTRLRELIGELNDEHCSKKIIKGIISGDITADNLVHMNFNDLANTSLKRQRSHEHDEAINGM